MSQKLKGIQDAMIAMEVASLDEVDADGNPLYDPMSEDFHMDTMAWARLFNCFPQTQLEIIVCLHLGFKPNEIVKMLGMANITKYYNETTRLREIYQQNKGMVLDI